MTEILDNPVWHALTGPQKRWALCRGQACRFHPDAAPFFAIREAAADAYADLGRILEDTPEARLFRAQVEPTPVGWTRVFDKPILQMLLPAHAGLDESDGTTSIRDLGVDDAGDMLRLAEVSRPGPFASRTHELGAYVGIRVDSRLVAMAGERFHLPGFVEISAIATDPAFRGRGYGHLLTTALAHRIRHAGGTPFLHVFPDNVAAVRLYRSLGFRERKELRIVWLARSP